MLRKVSVRDVRAVGIGFGIWVQYGLLLFVGAGCL